MTADAVERLRAALAEMTRRRDEWRKKAEGHDDLRAAVRAGIEQAGNRDLSRVFLRGALVESEQSLAEARAENARLRAENATAYQRGASAMQERAAYEVAELFEHHCAERGWKYGEQQAAKIARAIRALPIPDKEGA